MMKDNTVYNHSDNEVLVKTNGDLIYISYYMLRKNIIKVKVFF